MGTLIHKKIVVTGASGVLGKRLCEAFLNEGAQVAMLGRTQTKLETAAEELINKGCRPPLVLPADVCDKKSLLSARDTLQRQWPGIDILINGAGGNRQGATTVLENIPLHARKLNGGFFDLDVDEINRVMQLNFTGTFLACQVFAESMAEHGTGAVLNISSMSAQRPLTKVPGYSAAKAGVDNFTGWLAVHLAPRGVRVNALAPGFFATEQNRFLLYREDGQSLTDRGRKIIDQTPLARFGVPDDLVAAAIFLVSDAAAFITGTTLAVDGGFSAYSGV